MNQSIDQSINQQVKQSINWLFSCIVIFYHCCVDTDLAEITWINTTRIQWQIITHLLKAWLICDLWIILWKLTSRVVTTAWPSSRIFSMSSWKRKQLLGVRFNLISIPGGVPGLPFWIMDLILDEMSGMCWLPRKVATMWVVPRFVC